MMTEEQIIKEMPVRLAKYLCCSISTERSVFNVVSTGEYLNEEEVLKDEVEENGG